MKKIILLFITLLLTGCTDYRELNDMSIASVIAIEKKENYKVYVEVLSYSGTADNKEEKNIIYEGSGNTLHNAFRNVLNSSPNKLYAGHINTLIVSEELAKIDISSIFDFILRDAEVEKSFTMLVTNEKLEDILKISSKTDINVDLGIDASNKYVSSSIRITFDDFVSTTLKEGIDPVIPVVYIKDNKLYLKNYIGIFYDNKLEDYLSDDASIGYNIFNNNIDNNIIYFKCNNKDYSSIEVLDSNLDFNIKNSILNINLDIKGTLSEDNCNSDINTLTSKLKDKLKEILNTTIDEELKYSSDFLGFNQYVYRNNYNDYKNFNKKNITSNININIIFTSTGSIKEGAKY